MIARVDIVNEAREWLGTPFVEQAAVRGQGCDCAGLLRGVALAVGAIPEDYATRPEWQDAVRYGQVPQGNRLREICDRFMTPISTVDAQPGDAVLFRIGELPQHLGILAPYARGGLSLIHAARTRDGKGRVLEVRFSGASRLKLVAAYRLPGVE